MVDLFLNVILPIFILVGVGFFAGRGLGLDLRTLNRIVFWLYSPAILLVIILDTTLQAASLPRILLFSVVQWGFTFLLGFGLYSLRQLDADRATMAFGTAFFNGGNLGLPLMLLTFGQGAVAIHTVPLVLQSLLMFTVGIMLLDPKSTSIVTGLRQLVKVPVLWAIALGVVLRLTGVILPGPLRIPLDHFYDGYIALALIALGAQLAQVKPVANMLPISPALVTRLLISPAVAVGLVIMLGLEGLMAQTLVLGAGLPTAVNTYVISFEYNRDPDLASLLVFWSTLISGMTLPLLGGLVQQIF